jgi:ATP-dependent Clp protease ATP-binding subunit ClpC
MEAPAKNIYYYNEPRLAMTVAGRFIVRLLRYASYGGATVGAAVLWSSDVPSLHATGALIALFLMSRALCAHKAERSIARVSPRHPNVRLYITPETQTIIEQALDKAVLRGGDVRLYILQALIARPEIQATLVRLDVDVKAYAHKVAQYIHDGAAERVATSDSLAAISELVLAAFWRAVHNYGAAVEPHYLFGAFADIHDERLQRLFTLFDIQSGDLDTAFLFGKGRQKDFRGFIDPALKKRHRIMNRAWTARPTPTLDSYADDITDAMRMPGAWVLVGHEAEYERLITVLSQPGTPSVLLVGEPGSGKSALIHHLAFQIVRDRVPAPLFDKRIVSLSLSDVSAGADPAQIQLRLKNILEEIERAGNVILCIPDVHLLLKTGAGSLSGADVLTHAIRQGRCSVIGTSYPREYKHDIEADKEFAASFERVEVEELSEAAAVRYLVYASLVLEKKSGIIITFRALKEAVKIAHRYLRPKLLPGSAEDLLKEVIAGAALHHGRVLVADDVIVAAEQQVHVTLHPADNEERRKLLNLEQVIHERFVGQDEAVSAVSKALREYRAGVARTGGPIASFLFCGPTGVGKTELAKLVAEVQFGDRRSLIRFDMTEYQDKQSVVRLIGSADGELRGALTDSIAEKPYSLILLDELEKANPDVLGLFLQVLDDGRLTDGLGRTVDFQNAIIIATSNAHSVLIQDQIRAGMAPHSLEELLKSRLTEYFKPELINRFSRVVVFAPLSADDTVAVARLALAELSTSIEKTQAISVVFDESAIQEVARRGYDPVFGARPLRQTINDTIRSVLAERILKGEIVKGNTVRVSYDEQGFSFITSGR